MPFKAREEPLSSEQSLVGSGPACVQKTSCLTLSTGSTTQALTHEQDAPGTGRCSLPWGLDELRRTDAHSENIGSTGSAKPVSARKTLKAAKAC